MASIARGITQWQRSEIQRLFRSARVVERLPEYDIKAAHRSGSFSRVLIVISKSVGSAPTRNKIRRRLKALFYEDHLHEGPYDWLIFVKKAAADQSWAHTKVLLHQAVIKAVQHPPRPFRPKAPAAAALPSHPKLSEPV